MQLWWIKWLVAAIFVGSAAVVHLRGRERFGFLRQLFNHSTLLAPFNVLAYAFSRVPSSAWIDRSRFPELDALRDHYTEIRDEALALNAPQTVDEQLARNFDLGFNSFFKTGWRRFYLSWYGKAVPSAAARCPRTVELLRAIPSVRGAMFAILPPGAFLNPHRDPFAGSLRYHLGLVTPNSPDCSITVDGQNYFWRDGEDVMFDETFIHHARNDTQTERIILFCDVERPLHFAPMRWLNRAIARVIVSAGASGNAQGDPVGALNRMYGTVVQPVGQRLDTLARSLKRRNRTAFRVVKYAAIALILLAIVRWL